MGSCTRRSFTRKILLASGLVFSGALSASRLETSRSDSKSHFAIRGATIIDGNGGPPLKSGTILVGEKRIAEVGPTAQIALPSDINIIDGSGCFVIPGLIDTNVHLFNPDISALNEQVWDQRTDLISQAAQRYLEHGVTTIRDSMGFLEPLLKVRDAIASNQRSGSRILVAGNIIGWGGPFSRTYGGGVPKTEFQNFINDQMTHGVGENLVDLSPSEVVSAISAYLDSGVDFIKYGATPHLLSCQMLFSERVQEAIIREAHRCSTPVDTHANGTEAKMTAVMAGVDLIQHADCEIPEPAKPLSDELLCMANTKGVICSINSMEHAPETQYARKQRWLRDGGSEKSWLEGTRIAQTYRHRVQQLISRNCIVTIASDMSYSPSVSELLRQGQSYFMPGHCTILAVEGAVECGLTPMQALVAATRNGAQACSALDDYGTLEKGKFADLVVLDASPLESIGNIRRRRFVMKEGEIVQPKKIPT